MWFRDGAQVIFVLIIDVPAHHFGDLAGVEGGSRRSDLIYERSLLAVPRAITVYSLAYDDEKFRGLASEAGG